MFLEKRIDDITNEEFQNIILPHIEITNTYLEEKIIPMTVSHYISTGFENSSLFENTFDIHINSCIDVFNYNPKDMVKLKNRIKDILLNEYNMKITNETPLIIEKTNR